MEFPILDSLWKIPLNSQLFLLACCALERERCRTCSEPIERVERALAAVEPRPMKLVILVAVTCTLVYSRPHSSEG